MTAFSSAQLVISNKALGYNITFDLDKFTYYNNHFNKNGKLGKMLRQVYSSYKITGQCFFSDQIQSLNEIQKHKVAANRKDAYLNSEMHFFQNTVFGRKGI